MYSAIDRVFSRSRSLVKSVHRRYLVSESGTNYKYTTIQITCSQAWEMSRHLVSTIPNTSKGFCLLQLDASWSGFCHPTYPTSPHNIGYRLLLVRVTSCGCHKVPVSGGQSVRLGKSWRGSLVLQLSQSGV